MSGGNALPGGPGVAPPRKPFQNRPGPAGDDSGMNLLGATSVEGGARRGFCRRGAGVIMLVCEGWKGVSRYEDDNVGFIGE